MTYLSKLFLSLDGRIRRSRFWLGLIVIWIVEMALEWIVGVPIGSDPTTFQQRAIASAIGLLMIYPTVAVVAKRLHDRDQSAVYVWLLVAAFSVMLIGNLFGYFDQVTPKSWTQLVLGVPLEQSL